MTLKFRPHHFLCTLGFQGRGYSPEFVENYQKISDQLNAPQGDSEVIEVVENTDTICQPCPNRVGTACTTEAKIRQLDENHQRLIGFTPGQTLTWGEAKDRVLERVGLEGFHQACSPCSWKALGFCEKALIALREKRGLLIGALFLTGVFSGGSLIAAPAVGPLKEVAQLRSLSTCRKILKTSLYFDHAQALLARGAVERAEKAVRSRRWMEALRLATEARKHWLAIQEQYSSSPWQKKISEELGRVDLVEAETFARLKRFTDSRRVFERAWDRVYFSSVTPKQIQTYFKVCQKLHPNFWKDFERADLCALWSRRLLSSFPDSSPEIQELSKEWRPLIETLSEVLLKSPAPRISQSYSQTEDDVEAWRTIVPLLREKNFRSAGGRLEDFLIQFPRSHLKQKVRYWLAISKNDGKQTDEKALLLFDQVAREAPLSFYGLLSALQLGKSPEDFLVQNPVDLKMGDSNLHPSEVLSLEKAKRLIEAGGGSLAELAQMELRRVRPKETHESEFLAFLAQLNHRAGSHLGAFAALTELIQRGAEQAKTRWAVDLVFPVEYWADILKNAEAKKIDPIWVLSLIKQESAFDLGALSSSGAVGLMQVMPATAVGVDSSIHRVALSENTQNIRIGTAYMAEMLQRFHGNMALATAAYNAGPTAVDRWVKEFGLKTADEGLSLGVLEFIESIPYKETRDYVGSIIRNYYWYSRKLASEKSGYLMNPVSYPQPLKYFWTHAQQ